MVGVMGKLRILSCQYQSDGLNRNVVERIAPMLRIPRMFSIEKCTVPANTILDKYSINGAYADCYRTEISGQISFPEYLFAFYTTSIFKLERLILKWTVSKPSTDTQANQLANGDIEEFAAWNVEDRRENELLMCDFRGRTRSWLMITPVTTDQGIRTRLYFGSAVVPIRDIKTGKASLGFIVQALLGFHKIYSIVLLYSAKSKIERQFSRGFARQKEV